MVIRNNEDVIDSRDVIARIDELREILTDLYLQEEDTEEMPTQSFPDWLHNLVLDKESNYQEEAIEYTTLKALAEDAQSSPDWEYGEALINEDYFTQYIKELINDCYEFPKELDKGEWPWRHLHMDWEAAAEDAKQDYMEVDFDGQPYYIRA